MDLKEMRYILSYILFYSTFAEGLSDFTKGYYTMFMTGCTESFVKMECPGDDILSVMDIRIEITNSSEICYQHLPPQEVAVPKDFGHLCDPNKGHCIYIEDICEGLNECAFYVSPHYIDGKQVPTEDTEIAIEYTCKPGKGRQGGPIVVGLLAAVSTCALAVIGGLILYKEFKDIGETSTYNNFNNEAAPQPTSFTNPSTSFSFQQSSPEQISVQVRTPEESVSTTPADA